MNLILDSALKSTVILTAAWLAAVLLRRRSADVRHRIWLAAILAVAALPLASMLVERTPQARIAVTAAIVAGPARAEQAARAFPWLFTLWITGVTLIAGRIALGIARIAWITRKAEGSEGLLYSYEISTPVTWGVFRPVILLPIGREWSPVVIQHERAHIERHDWLWQILSRSVTAIFWFHPMVWLADAALRREAEQAVDNHVVHSGADPHQYAEQLLAAARHLTTVPAQSVAMVRTRFLESRVRSILDAKSSRDRASRFARISIAAFAAAMVLPLTAFQDATVHKIGEDGVKPPRVLEKVEPQYTEEAREAKIQGTTALQIVVDEGGTARDITVVRSLDAGLDANAITAVSQWKFAPATKDGNPVRVQANIEINFRLQ